MIKTIYFAGGCFWGVQRFFDQFNGVVETTVGYANGHSDHPTYAQVKSQESGHSETVRVVYNDDTLSLEKLLRYFYRIIDPTSLNKQGEDEGISYRTGIYYTDLSDQPVIQKVTAEIAQQYDKPLMVEIVPLDQFYDAEEYHQKYLEKNPAGYCHIPISLFHLGEDEL